MTPELAASRAADILDKAAEIGLTPGQVAALVGVADGWTRLHTALNASKWATLDTTERPLTVNIEGLAVKEDTDITKIGEQFAREWARAHGAWWPEPKPELEPEPEPEIGVYSERARLAAYLATQHPAKIAYNDPNEPDWPVIYIDTPRGQLSWHISSEDVRLFAHVPVAEGADMPEWDGHTTPEKYERLALLVQDKAQGQSLT
jgi:hypothetical protein